jgi:hypothetical protein
MSGLFGKKKSVSSSSPVISSLRVTTALAGKAIPIIWGKTRISPNVIEYVDFETIAHNSSSQSGGKGGGSSNNSDTSYTYTAALEMAICQGPINAVTAVWKDKTIYGSVTVPAQVVGASQSGVVNYDGSTTTLTVANASIFTADQGVTVSGAGLGGSGGENNADNQWLSYQLVAGTDYTESGGTYTLNASFCALWPGCSFSVSYTYTTAASNSSAMAAAGMGVIAGTIGQAPWSYMTAQHPTVALGYSGVALAVASNYQLDSDGSVPNVSFEIDTPFGYNSVTRDANPKDILYDCLTNPYYGAYYPAARIGDLSNWSAYCIASYFFLSPALTDQTSVSDFVTKLMKLTNSDCFFSEKKLKVVPYGDLPVSSGYGSWTPNLTAIYQLTDDSFLPYGGSQDSSTTDGDGDGTDGPVQLARKSPSSAYNSLYIKFYDRSQAYNENSVPCVDQANIDQFGVVPSPDYEAYEICDAGVARQVGQTMVQRGLYVRNTYTFTLPFSYALLEPMDLVTLTDAALGLNNALVRITSIQEDDELNLTFTAEEVPAGHASAILYPASSSAGYVTNYNVVPMNVQSPVFFEPPVALAGSTGLAVCVAVTGQAADPNWGGCDIWVSTDNATYAKLATLHSGARYGVLDSPIVVGSSTLYFDGAGLTQQILPGTAADAAAKSTLLWIQSATGGGEFLSYEGATLVGPYQYQLSGLVRGQYETVNGSHAGGASVVRFDSAVAQSEPLDLSQIGSTLFFKFTSFNQYGGGEQQLGDVSAYAYTITGAQTLLPPSNVASITATSENFGVRLTWPLVSDPDIAYYRLRVGGSGTAWAAGTPLVGTNAEGTHISGDSFFWGPQVAGTYKFMVKAVSEFGVESQTEASVTFAVAVPAPAGAAGSFNGANYVLTWTLAEGNFQIAGFNIYTGTSFGSATRIASGVQSNTFTQPAQWSGLRRFYVTAIDAAGNEGSPSEIDLNLASPGAPASFAGQNIDNSVLFNWALPTSGSLPVAKYSLSKGATFGASVLIGTMAGSATFDTYFESAAGMYSYWLTATDTAGNVSTPAAVTLNVAAPPNFILQSDIHSSFGGTLTDMFVSNGALYGPVNTSETMPGHGTNNSWSNPAAQVTAGYPLYFEPNASSGSYEEVIDYGSTIASSSVQMIYSIGPQAQGTVTITPKISISNTSATGPWTDYAGVSSEFCTNFRWVKYHLDFAGTPSGNLTELVSLEYKLSLKQKSDSGAGNAVSTDTSGTPINFNVAFLSVTSITITPVGSTPLDWSYTISSSPNPTSFNVFFWNSSGVRVNQAFTWQAAGV